MAYYAFKAAQAAQIHCAEPPTPVEAFKTLACECSMHWSKACYSACHTRMGSGHDLIQRRLHRKSVRRCEVNCTFSVRARPQGGSVGRVFRPMLLAPRCAGRVGRSGRPESVARALSGASGSVGRDGPSQCAAAPWASRSVGTDMFAWCTKIYFSTHTPQPHISTAPLLS